MTAPDELQIRRLVASDLEEVITLERATEGAPHWERAAYLQLFDRDVHSPLQRVCVIAVTGNLLAGFAILRALLVEGVSEAELESIVVRESARRQGVGTRLLKECIRLTREAGSAASLDLEVRASNLAARGLYRRIGMAEVALRRGYYVHPEEDAVLMRINL